MLLYSPALPSSSSSPDSASDSSVPSLVLVAPPFDFTPVSGFSLSGLPLVSGLALVSAPLAVMGLSSYSSY